MNLRTECPSCHSTFDVPRSLSGRKGHCRYCGFQLIFVSQTARPIAPGTETEGQHQFTLSPSRTCPKCNSMSPPSLRFCGNCGTAFIDGQIRRERSRITAALFAFFLGGVGAHRFYLGQPGMGVIYLLFCWTLIPGIAAFIEFLIYLTMSDETFAKRYG